jgi:hypothetical protein
MLRLRNIYFAVLLMAFFSTVPSRAQSAAPVRYRVIALAEPGHGLHQGFVDAALEFLEKTGAKEGFAVDYIRQQTLSRMITWRSTSCSFS